MSKRFWKLFWLVVIFISILSIPILLIFSRHSHHWKPPKNQSNAVLWHGKPLVAIYDYHDVNGKPIYQVCKTKDKDFPQRYYSYSKRKWVWNTTDLGDSRFILYHAPLVKWAVDHHKTIYITEGEKDADSINQRYRGVIATTSPMGTGKWLPSYNEMLKGAKEVRIWSDNDPQGIQHSFEILQQLSPHVEKIKIIKSKYGKDAYDHFSKGHNLSDIEQIT